MSSVRLPIVGVMGSHADQHPDRARRVGEWIANEGYHLLTGGGGGVMGEVTHAFVEVSDRRGQALGVIPCLPDVPQHRPVPGYPNPSVEIPIYTHLDRGGPHGDEPSSRNHINVLTSHVIILLPGGEGTASEARLALHYAKPCIAYLGSRGEIPKLPDGVPDESDFARVQEFVRKSLTRASRHTSGRLTR